MPWVDRPKAILETYLGGQAWGGAAADVLFGRANPCGRLAETFPARLEDNPSYLFFPGNQEQVEYREGVFVGYRWYEKKKVVPLFPFGHGLSYSRFEYSDLDVSPPRIAADGEVHVSVMVSNLGPLAGSEVVQLYVGCRSPGFDGPARQLEGFDKVSLALGERKQVRFTLSARSFSHWNTASAGWAVAPGSFEISIGASSADIRLSAEISAEPSGPGGSSFDMNTTVGEVTWHPEGKTLAGEITASFRGALAAEHSGAHSRMVDALVREMPLRAVISLSGGRFSRERIFRLLQRLSEAASGQRPDGRTTNNTRSRDAASGSTKEG
jgi:beta-glucosidase